MQAQYIKTFPKILEKCALHGATPILDSYRGALKPFDIKCKCGRVFTGYWSNLQKSFSRICCAACLSEFRSKIEKNRLKDRTLKEIVRTFKPFGSTPDLNSYVHSQSHLSFTCICGEKDRIPWASIQQEKAFPLCRKCALLQRAASIKRAFKESTTYKHPAGSKHHKWDPNKTNEDRILKRNVLWYEQWINTVFETGQYTCVITGQIGGALSAHHLFNWANFPEYRTATLNGVLLKRGLHKQFHDQYGRGQNTLEQFKEFYLAQTGRQFERTLSDIRSSINVDWPI